MGHYDDPEPSARPTQPRQRWLLPVVIAALVVGLASGYLLHYLTAEPPPPPPAPVAPPPAAAPPAPAPDRTPCVDVAMNGSAIITQLQQGVAAIGRLDPAELQRVLDQIQRLQAQLENAIGECRTAYGDNPPAPAPAPPAPAPPVPGPPGG